MVDIAPATLVDSRYVIIEYLGEGGVGTVFKARELGTERIVALKFLHLTLVSDQESVERFKREGDLLCRLEHPNILRCYRFGIWSNRLPYISTEYLSGAPLNTLGTLSPQRVLEIARQVCDAMEHAHQKNVIHRDLKPSNIIVDTESDAYAIKVVDFGLCRLTDAVSQHLTQTGELLGSPQYMSPEQCVGKKADAHSDIYSLGCILYELLAGEPPFAADSPMGLIYKHNNETPKPLVGTHLPAGCNTLVMRAMAKEPECRFKSMKEFDEALDLVLQGQGKRISGTAKTPGSTKSSRTLFALATLLLTIIIALGIITEHKQRKQQSVQQAQDVSSGLKSRSPNVYRDFLQRSRYSALHADQLHAWLRKYGAQDPIGTAIAHFYLSTMPAPPGGKQYGRLADKELSDLLNRDAGIRSRFPNNSNEEMFHMLIATRLDSGGLSGAYRCYCEFHQHVNSTAQRHECRTLTSQLNLEGLYAQEAKVWRSVRQPGDIERFMLARCIQRQNLPVTGLPSTIPKEVPQEYQETLVRALIELNQYDLAYKFIKSGHERYGNEPIMSAYCLTRQRKFEQAQTELLAELKQVNCYQKVSSPKLLPNVQRVLILAALVHNAAEQNEPVPNCVTSFIDANLKSDPKALLFLTLLSSRDSSEFAAQLGQHALICIREHRLEADTKVRMLTLLARIMNQIKRPDIAEEALSKECDQLAIEGTHSIAAYSEMSRSLRLNGKPEKAGQFIAIAEASCRDSVLGHPMIVRERIIMLMNHHRQTEALKLVERLTEALQTEQYTTVYRKFQLLEQLAEVCRQAKQTKLAAELMSKSEKVLPRHCRTHWQNWTDLDEGESFFDTSSGLITRS